MIAELLEPDTETPDLTLMPRADGLAILNDYRAKAEALKVTAETLNVTRIDDTGGQKLARATRLSLREIRIAVEKRRVELVEDMTKETRRINAAAKAVKDFIEPLETRLLEQELFAERERERLRNELRRNRLEELSPFMTSPPAVDLGLMEPDAYAQFLADQKELHAVKLQREKAAEELRLKKEKEEAEERERMRVENERLKAEAAERERVAAEERRKAEEERRAMEEAARKEREAAAKALRIEREAREAEARKEREAAAAKQREIEAVAAEERRKAEAALQKERAAREEAERKEREAKAAEQRRRDEEERAADEKRRREAEAARKAESAPDKEKLMAFRESLRALPVPMLSAGNHHIESDLKRRLAGAATWIKAQADEI